MRCISARIQVSYCMKKRKLRRIDWIILIGFVNSVLAFLGIWLWFKAPDRKIYVPRDYEGWVKITYRVEEAPALKEDDGTQILMISDSGTLQTSTHLEVGWHRDDFYWADDQSEVPRYVEVEGEAEPYRFIFDPQPLSMFYKNIVRALPPGRDTTLADKTQISKSKQGQVDYQPGKKRLEYFYLCKDPKPFSFIPPPLEDPEALQSLDSRLMKE